MMNQSEIRRRDRYVKRVEEDICGKKPLDLYDVYKKPSAAKKGIWEDIRSSMSHYQCAWGLTIVSYNIQSFTCGFYYYENDARYGRLKFFKYITPTWSHVIEVVD